MDLTKIRNAKRCVALGGAGDKIVDGVYEYLEGLMCGKGPKAYEVDQLDSFFKVAVKRIENFCTSDVGIVQRGPTSFTHLIR